MPSFWRCLIFRFSFTVPVSRFDHDSPLGDGTLIFLQVSGGVRRPGVARVAGAGCCSPNVSYVCASLPTTRPLVLSHRSVLL